MFDIVWNIVGLLIGIMWFSWMLSPTKAAEAAPFVNTRKFLIILACSVMWLVVWGTTYAVAYLAGLELEFQTQ